MIETIFVLIIFTFVGLLTIILSFSMGRKNNLEKTKHMIPEGKPIYEDLFEQSKPLYSSVFFLAGKPDYILKTNDAVIPVEVKTGNYNQPQKHHIMQLATYCQLVEERFGKRPAHGLLVYYDSKKQFQIPFTNVMKRQLSETVEMMKQISEKGWDDSAKNLIDTRKCGSCSMKSYCDIAKKQGK